MTTSILLALLNAVPGQDEEFNRWYEEEHLEDVLNIPHVLRGSRFQVDDAAAPNDQTPWKYLTIYTVESGTEEAVTAELKRRVRIGEIAMSPSLAPSTRSWFFREISSRAADQR